MAKQVLINVPVKDLEVSKEFFSKIGFLTNVELTDKHAACFHIDENVLITLLGESRFKAVTNHDIADTTKTSEVLIAVGMRNKGEVNALVDSAIAAGASELHEPKDLGWIYGRSFADLDGHQWNIFYKTTKQEN